MSHDSQPTSSASQVGAFTDLYPQVREAVFVCDV